MSARYLRSTARSAVLLAATILAACAVNSPPPPSGGGESDIDTIAVSSPQSDDNEFFSYDSPRLTGENSQIIPDSMLSATDLPDSSAADYDRMFLEIHADLSVELRKLEKTDKDGTRLAEIQSIVKTAEEFYLEGKPLFAIRLLTEAELLLRQVP